MKKSIFISLTATVIAFFVSCTNEIKNQPIVTINEANIEGTYICVEADIQAANKTQSIRIEVLDAAGQTKLSKDFADSKYVGKLNIPEFHEHIDINNADVHEGDLLRMTVTDQQKLQTVATKALTEEEEEDED